MKNSFIKQKKKTSQNVYIKFNVILLLYFQISVFFSLLYHFSIFSIFQQIFTTNRKIPYMLPSLRYILYIEVGESPVGIFCDLSLAFDWINSELLFFYLNMCRRKRETWKIILNKYLTVAFGIFIGDFIFYSVFTVYGLVSLHM